MNPVTAFQCIVVGVGAFLVGLMLGALPAYFIGKAHEAEKKGVQIGALSTSVESCTVAAKEAKKAVDDEATAGKDREQRLAAAIAEGARIAAASARARSATLATPLRGDTDCQRTSNAIADHFRKGAR